MDWKYDSTKAACIISAFYSTNYVFTCVHMPEEYCCTLRMQNLKKKKINNRGHLFSLPSSCTFRLDHQEVDFGIRLVY